MAARFELIIHEESMIFTLTTGNSIKIFDSGGGESDVGGA